MRFKINQDINHNMKLVKNYTVKGWQLGTVSTFDSGKLYGPQTILKFENDNETWNEIGLPNTPNSERLLSIHHLDITLKSSSGTNWSGNCNKTFMYLFTGRLSSPGT